MPKSKQENKKRFQIFGLIIAGLFYLTSIIMVFVNTSGQKILDPSLKIITFAHWQLEDGFREGYDEAIRMFEKHKAEQGEKVKVIQTTVPYRGYRQWFLTQLIGGTPADIIELSGSSAMRNQYFVPLSSYISKPNPFNKNTPFEGVPWKDSFHDNMNSALDPSYGEYFGVGMFSAVYRIYVNIDLIEKATGSRELPKTLGEWLASCEKLREYGKKDGIPIIPIGVRGFDKGTLNYLFTYYFSQLNCDLHDTLSENCSPDTSSTEILTSMVNKKLDSEKLLATVDIIQKLGQYFGEGFMATDLEQTKFLFFSGSVGFFPEGTWNAYSMVENSPFEVGIMELPVIGKNSKHSKYFVGRPTEQGLGVGGQFGIPKNSKNFDLALEFLQFSTSWKINQMIMVDYCKWLPAVKRAKYKGILKYCKPQVGSGRRRINPPFMVGAKSKCKMLETLETIITDEKDNPENFFMEEFLRRIPSQLEECRENIIATKRTLLSIEKQRSAIAVFGLVSKLPATDMERLDIRYELMQISLISNYNNLHRYQKHIDVLRKLQKEGGE